MIWKINRGSKFCDELNLVKGAVEKHALKINEDSTFLDVQIFSEKSNYIFQKMNRGLNLLKNKNLAIKKVNTLQKN